MDNNRPAKSIKITSVDFNDEDTSSTDKTHLRNFKNYRICKASRKTLRSKGITELFPIQYMTFDHVYDRKDVIGQASK